MVKVITFIKRKPGMPVEEFQAYWRSRHPEVVTRLPGVRRYVQSHTLLSAYENGTPTYDGIAEVWADDTAALRAFQILSEDEGIIPALESSHAVAWVLEQGEQGAFSDDTVVVINLSGRGDKDINTVADALHVEL